MNFSNRTVLVTGAAGNLGRAIVDYFVKRGANVIALDRDRERLNALYGQESDRQMHLQADLLDGAAVGEALASAVARFSKIDVLCNVAGGFRMGAPVHETSDQDWSFLFDLNARSVLNCARSVVPMMLAQGGGKIVNVAAFSALRGQAHMGAYCASKDVVVRLTESMAAELRDSNINVNCVLPSIIDTPENRAAMPDADASRWVVPSDLALVIGFLASEESAAIRGAAIPVTART